MAAKDLDINDDKKQEELEDITTCCICTEVYTDPKALPCIHTFCMKCLRENGLKTNKGPGDEMPCPICRRLFKIPLEGFHGLPKHFFIERLVQLSKASDSSSVTKALCSLCSEDCKEQANKECPTAEAYCVHCTYKLCEECCKEHVKFKATRNHKLIPITEYESSQNVLADLQPSACEIHQQTVMDVYCTDCKTVVCAICFIEEHFSHKGAHIDKCVDGSRKQMLKTTEAMNVCKSRAQTKKAEIMKMKEEVQKHAESIESDIDSRKEQIKQLADKHTSSLQQSLYSERQRRLKEIQMAMDDIDAYLLKLESYNYSCKSITTKGSENDICSALSDLSIRATELEQQCQPIIEREIQDFKLYFRQSELEELLEENSGNLVGELEDDLKPKKTIKHVLLAEQSKLMDIFRKKNEDLRKECANYNAQTEKLKQQLEKNKTVINTLQTNNDKEKKDSKAHIEKLKQELENNKSVINALKNSNDKEKKDSKAHIEKLKQEQQNNKKTINGLQVSINKLKKELHEEEINNGKLLEELNMYKKKLRKAQGELRYSSDPALAHTMTTKASVEGYTCRRIAGFTILDKQLFAVTQCSSAIEVYDMMKLDFIRLFYLQELIDPRDIASCKRNKCIYIAHMTDSTAGSAEILRVDLFGKLINIWSTPGLCGGLSVTDESNVLLAVCKENKLNEYSPDGQVLREINAGIHWPWHAIKLTSGQFVVSHGNGDSDLHRVCIVDADGKLQKSFGETRGSTIERMNEPYYLTVDINEFVMVVDQGNNRVLLLNSDLEIQREILSKPDGYETRAPWRIIFYEPNGRLIISDGEAISAIDLVSV